MSSKGNVTCKCKECGRRFAAWASANRVFCSTACRAKGSRGALTHGGSHTRLYTIWNGMKQRCYGKTSAVYAYYGGRGITVCDSWRKSFESFRDWAHANGYEPKLELDRIDVNGSYEPANCRWATRQQQMFNTRKPRNAKTSRYKGVSWNAIGRNWKAQIGLDGKTKHIGVYPSALAAALAYDDMAHVLRGEHAFLNFPERKREEVSHVSS